MKLRLTSAGITNNSIREALVDMLGKSIAVSKAICPPLYAIDDQTAIKIVDSKVEVISEGEWNLFEK